jgi:hypothetical protein
MKIGGHAPLYGTNWQSDLPLKKPVFLCSIGYVVPDKKNVEPDAWFPTMRGFDAKEAGDVLFPGVAMFVVAYEKGDPKNLRWLTYLP